MDDRRSEPRYEPPQPLSAKVKSSLPARVVDLSARGVQLEIAHSLRPNVSCEVRVQLDGGEVGIRAAVRRCRAVGFGQDERQRTVLLYRAGLEFEDVTADAHERLVEALRQAALSQTGAQVLSPAAAGGAVSSGGGLPGTEDGQAPLPRAPRPSGPIKIRISSEHVRKIMGTES